MHPLTGVLIGEYVRQMLSNGKNVSFFELPEAISYIIGAFPLEYATDLYFLVLMKLGEKIIPPVLLEQKGCVFRFGYAEWEYFHELKIAKYYLNNLNKSLKRVE